MSERRIGVYICHCGGNISDYVDVARVRDAVAGEPGVVHAETTMFTCSDGTQHDMLQKIQDEHLDGLVVASCSPKLHQITFRGVARRAGMNPFQYTQVNVREQDSWAHGDDPEGATQKAIGLIRAGIAKTRASVPLEPIGVDTTSRALVVGGGIAGLRAAIGLADLGLGVTLVERESELGGWAAGFGPMFPSGRTGRELVANLVAEVRRRPAITVFTRTELVGKSGTFGNYSAELRIAHRDGGAFDSVRVEVGAIIVATGFDSYQPQAGEFGYGIEGVLTLPEFKALVDGGQGPLRYRDRNVRTVAYIYCVGSRQPAGQGNEYCSKYCCSTAVHGSIQLSRRDAAVRQYHLHRDIRTYGRHELMYEDSRKLGSVYMKFPDDTPPTVERGPNGRLLVTTVDALTGGERVSLEADLVVLVTGMVPRENTGLTDLLKLPLGGDGFYNEIHPKLRPVETVVDGVMIAGTCQGPKTSSESVASGLAAVTQCGAMLMRGTAELDPLVAVVHADACTWCGKCEPACPYGAIHRAAADGREVATIDATACKGCGGCAPYCPEDAIDLLGSTDEQIRGMIDTLLEAPVA
ncbi:MAG: CoB--CoM heterodisulfide reductase iron-sulfur subunit A family protein [Gemmatimonadota bacterium]|nr:CoB--CoM heterodisulfide reductase iron-sulfur subunit A family protein [Gemmatimonadota bacterium]